MLARSICNLVKVAEDVDDVIISIFGIVPDYIVGRSASHR